MCFPCAKRGYVGMIPWQRVCPTLWHMCCIDWCEDHYVHKQSNFFLLHSLLLVLHCQQCSLLESNYHQPRKETEREIRPFPQMLARLTGIPNLMYCEYWFTKHFCLDSNSWIDILDHQVLFWPSISYWRPTKFASVVFSVMISVHMVEH